MKKPIYKTRELFKERGWVVVDMIDPSPIALARETLQKHLHSFLGKKASLEEYHHEAEVAEDARHTEIQVEMASFFRKQKFGKKIIEKQIEFFERFIGLDLLVQENPYLRITRPFKKQDNIGYHRDTFYGGSPYELSILIPFVNLDEKGSLKVLTGSHILPESDFPTTKIENPDPSISKGSAKHQLGFLYSPKVMDLSIEGRMQPIPLTIGQALIFSLSVVHGSVENQSKITRWSTDMRVLNPLAPVDLSARPTYYEPLTLSPVTECAQKYYKANELQPVGA